MEINNFYIRKNTNTIRINIHQKKYIHSILEFIKKNNLPVLKRKWYKIDYIQSDYKENIKKLINDIFKFYFINNMKSTDICKKCNLNYKCIIRLKKKFFPNIKWNRDKNKLFNEKIKISLDFKTAIETNSKLNYPLDEDIIKLFYNDYEKNK